MFYKGQDGRSQSTLSNLQPGQRSLCANSDESLFGKTALLSCSPSCLGCSPLASVLGWCLVLSELLNTHCPQEAGLEREINCQSAKIACGKTHVRKEITP